MNNFTIQIPIWILALIALIIALALIHYSFKGYQAFLKFLVDWKHGRAPITINIESLHRGTNIIRQDGTGLTAEELEDKINSIFLKAVQKGVVDHG